MPIAFGIINQVNDEIMDQAQKRRFLELKIREELINPIIFALFIAHGCSPHYAKESKINRKYGNIIGASKEKYEELNYYQMTFRRNTIRPNALKYTEEGLFDKRLHRHSCLLNTIYIIDWNKQGKTENRVFQIKTNPRFAKKIQYISLFDLFNDYFSKEEYDLFVKKVRKTIINANNIFGFDTVRILTPIYMHQIKTVILNNLISWNLKTKKYFFIQYDHSVRHEITIEKNLALLLKDKNGSSIDMDIILRNCYQSQRYKVMVGLEEFSKCFITAEYLLSVFENKQYNIEYTTVACGYFKFMEQLIYQIIIKIFLESGEHGNRTIKAVPKKYKKIPRESKEKLNKLHNAKTIDSDRVPFKKEYEKAFDIMLNPLICFLEQSDDFWDVSPVSKTLICELLHNYANHCRNEHFHKDNIFNFDEIRKIRENTITLALLLLGALKIPPELVYDGLCTYDNTYDTLVEALMKREQMIAKNSTVYYLQFDQDIIMAHRYKKQVPIEIDKNGNLGINKFRFVSISNKNEFRHISEEKYEKWFNSKEIIEINQEHYPRNIWFEIANSQHERVLLWTKEK